MYVCLCKAITDDQLRKSTSTHTSNPTDVCKRLGVGSDCGVCLDKALKILQEPLGPQTAKCDSQKS